MTEPLLLSATRIQTFAAQRACSTASGFFFERGEHLYLVTSRHVLCDPPSGHFPDHIVIELHTSPGNLALSTGFSIPLYRAGEPLWQQARDRGGAIDVATIELERDALPGTSVLSAFSVDHLYRPDAVVELGATLLVVGFPLGFHDTLHHTPVARSAVLASAFGLRFQGEGYFLTDARTHRGTSGAPVVMRVTDPEPALAALPWRLLGVHSACLEVGNRNHLQDEALGLNCAWYADVLLALTAAPQPGRALSS